MELLGVERELRRHRRRAQDPDQLGDVQVLQHTPRALLQALPHEHRLHRPVDNLARLLVDDDVGRVRLAPDGLVPEFGVEAPSLGVVRLHHQHGLLEPPLLALLLDASHQLLGEALPPRGWRGGEVGDDGPIDHLPFGRLGRSLERNGALERLNVGAHAAHDLAGVIVPDDVHGADPPLVVSAHHVPLLRAVQVGELRLGDDVGGPSLAEEEGLDEDLRGGRVVLATRALDLPEGCAGDVGRGGPAFGKRDTEATHTGAAHLRSGLRHRVTAATETRC